MKELYTHTHTHIYIYIFRRKSTRKPLPLGKHKRLIDLIKNERGSKIVTKFGTTAPKAYGCKVQKDDHEIEDF